MLTAPSSGEVVTFPSADKTAFAAASKTWLKTVLANPQLTHANKILGAALYLHFNKTHFERTGELIAWPAWKTLMTETTLGKTAIYDGIKQFERFRLLEVEHGRYDRSTQRRAGNLYHVPRFATTNLAPDQGSRPRFGSKVRHGEQDSVSRLGESDSVRKKERIKVGNSRKEGKESKQASKPSENSPPSNSKSSEPAMTPHPPSSARPPSPARGDRWGDSWRRERRRPRQRLSTIEP